jgi:hypothetical protein
VPAIFVIPGRAKREPGTQADLSLASSVAACAAGWIPGSVLRTASE